MIHLSLVMEPRSESIMAIWVTPNRELSSFSEGLLSI